MVATPLDATCSDTFSASHKEIAVREPGAVAAAAEHRTRSKYCNFDATHHFVPIAVETLGVLGQDARSFFRKVARRVTAVTNKPQSHQSLLQRVAVAIQRGNAAAIWGRLGMGVRTVVFSSVWGFCGWLLLYCCILFLID